MMSQLELLFSMGSSSEEATMPVTAQQSSSPMSEPLSIPTDDSSRSSNSSTARSQRRRVVTFGAGEGDDDVQRMIWEVPQRDELSKEERSMLWYNEKELRKMQKRLKKVLRGKRTLDEQDENCLRGLEYYLEEQNDKNFRQSVSAEEALLMSDMRAAQDSAEAYTIYLEAGMDVDFVNSCFQ